MKTTETDTPQLQSKLDSSGTDPNRYAAFYSEEEAQRLGNVKHKAKPVVKGLQPNVSKLERILMVAGGTYLLYKALSGKKNNISKGIAGGTMLARGISGYCPVYDLAEKSGTFKSANVNIRTTITIDKPVSEVYALWRNLENLPKFMSHLDSVKEINKTTSEWRAKGPSGFGHISWKANILMDEKDHLLSWHSVPDSTIDNAGKIYFRENGPESTALDITISYHAPLGIAGEAAAKLLNPWFTKMVNHDIENLKSYIETGQNELSHH
ncbi:SRPBCC family protein [Flavobacterium pallidum]|uniref:Cyclase n=1 Tax=Flavobacterium pallidum TaxID=2172098 RepID=A0A2S1SJD5_9FLAO|nr:SRPBCC family protein [Flavobacterium pallidum]AWI26533.1 cyclase [Flavobacterium pallidum]